MDCFSLSGFIKNAIENNKFLKMLNDVFIS
jgi:hypothetical protein